MCIFQWDSIEIWIVDPIIVVPFLNCIFIFLDSKKKINKQIKISYKFNWNWLKPVSRKLCLLSMSLFIVWPNDSIGKRWWWRILLWDQSTSKANIISNKFDDLFNVYSFYDFVEFAFFFYRILESTYDVWQTPESMQFIQIDHLNVWFFVCCWNDFFLVVHWQVWIALSSLDAMFWEKRFLLLDGVAVYKFDFIRSKWKYFSLSLSKHTYVWMTNEDVRIFWIYLLYRLNAVNK